MVSARRESRKVTKAWLNPVEVEVMFYDGTDVSFNAITAWMDESGHQYFQSTNTVFGWKTASWREGTRKHELTANRWIVKIGLIFRVYSEADYALMFSPKRAK